MREKGFDLQNWAQVRFVREAVQRKAAVFEKEVVLSADLLDAVRWCSATPSQEAAVSLVRLLSPLH